jgi:hypothetical protein
VIADRLNPGIDIPVEIDMLRSLSNPFIIGYIDHWMGQKYIILVIELHGVEWDPSNPLLSAAKNPGLKTVSITPDDCDMAPSCQYNDDIECSPLYKMTMEQKKELKKKTACDLFECIDARKNFLLN